MTWSRFALKLYLQAVKFIPSLATIELVGDEAVDQEYTTGDGRQFTVSDTYWVVQTFTPASTGKITKVRLKLFRNALTGDMTVKITKVRLKLFRNALTGDMTVKINTTDGDGYPTDTVLCSMVFNTEPITTESPGDWYEFSFDEPATLTKEIVYAILIHGTPGLPNPMLYCRADGTAPQYFRGCVYHSTNSGGSWTRDLYDDLMFQTFVFLPGEKRTYGTLDVRHPALLAVVQKRGELTVKGYDTLSSLDGEYLTRQLGLDVEAGDVIEATTLPGIVYKYLVR
ncbi:hypothetical protein ES708_34402 [subsurface metagenome]